MKKQKGFTLIELIVVIVVLGILAAFAIPKYMTLDKEARISTIRNLGGSVQAAATLVHAIGKAQVANGSIAANPANITIDGTTKVDVNNSTLYPLATNAGIIAALENITSAGYIVNSENPMVIQKSGASDLSNCSVTYNDTAAPPNVEVKYNGC